MTMATRIVTPSTQFTGGSPLGQMTKVLEEVSVCCPFHLTGGASVRVSCGGIANGLDVEARQRQPWKGEKGGEKETSMHMMMKMATT
jgi:hypothetical protein